MQHGRFRRGGWLAALLFAVLAFSRIASAESGNTYWPLANGSNTFSVYATPSSTTPIGSLTMQATNTGRTINGAPVFDISLSSPMGDIQKVFLSSDANGVRWHGSQRIGGGSLGNAQVMLSASPAITLLPANFATTQTTYPSGTGYGTVTGYGSDTGTYSGTIATRGFESVTVPAGGPFQALRLDVDFTKWSSDRSYWFSTKFTAWLVKDLGLVKMTCNDSTCSGQTLKLVSSTLPIPTTTTTTAATTTTTRAATTTTITVTTTTTASTTTTTLAGGLAFVPGWNLAGNGSDSTINVASTFGNAGNVSTVWKWLASKGGWAFYTPTLADGGASYAAGKGYDFLASIGPGEGYWVNAKQAFSISPAAGNALTASYFQTRLPGGWSLVAIGEAKTPRQFNDSLSLTPPSPSASVVANLTTLWAWDAAQAAWYFYAPSLESSSSLASYTATKGYLDFAAKGKTLGNGIGFWVNMPSSNMTTTQASAVSGSCGSSSGTTLASAPTANLCTTGTANSVSGSGPWSWSCQGSNGGSTASCSAIKQAVATNGSCGTSNDTTLSSAPTANLCTAGTPTSVSGTGPWSWSCQGSNGGSSMFCSARTQAAKYVSQGGLTWMPVDIMSSADWTTASNFCKTAVVNGLTGWRLPTESELINLAKSGALIGQGWYALGYTWSSYPSSSSSHYTRRLSDGDGHWSYDWNSQLATCVRKE